MCVVVVLSIEVNHKLANHPPFMSRYISKVLTLHSKFVRRIAVSPDGKYTVYCERDNNIYRTRLEDGKVIEKITTEWGFDQASITPDGNYLITVCFLKIKVFRINDNKPCSVQHWDKHYTCNGSFCVTPDSKHVVYVEDGENGSTLKMVKVESGELVRYFKGHTDVITNVCVTPDNKYLVSASDDGTIRVTRIQDGVLSYFIDTMDYSPLFSVSVTRLCVTPNGKYIVCAYVYVNSNDRHDIIRIIRLKDGKVIRLIEPYTGRILCMCVTHDSQFVVSGSLNSIRITRIKNGSCVHNIMVHRSSIRSLCLTHPCDKYIVSCSTDETVRVTLNPLYIQKNTRCRQWARLFMIRKDTVSLRTLHHHKHIKNKRLPIHEQLLIFFQLYPGLVRDVGTTLLHLCVTHS